MKVWYDKNARNRNFKPGDKVLVFLHIPGHPLQARYYGPYEIESKISDVNYAVSTQDRQEQKQVCHINMLKCSTYQTNPFRLNPRKLQYLN